MSLNGLKVITDFSNEEREEETRHNLQYIHLIKQLPDVEKAREDLIQKFESHHEDDVSNYICDFKRWGDWLTIHLQRYTGKSQFKFATTINLALSHSFGILPGRALTLDGRVHFKNSGKPFFSIMPNGVFKQKYEKAEVEPIFPSIGINYPYHLSNNNTVFGAHGMTMANEFPWLGGFPSPYEDDVIQISCSDTSHNIRTPYGLGNTIEEKLKKVLQAGYSGDPLEITQDK